MTNSNQGNGTGASASANRGEPLTTTHRFAEPEGEEERSAAARSHLYAVFAQAMTYPDDDLCQWIRDGGVVGSLREQLPIATPGLNPNQSIDGDALADAGAGDELSVEYTRLFDAGAKGPPCPLYGGLYGQDRMKTMEEALRFYNHFGLTLSEEQRELPDHLVTQLEFLHYLAFRELASLQQGADPCSLRRAQRDFIERHPGRWVPQLCEKLVQAQAGSFFAALLGELQRLLSAERIRLADTP